MVASDLDAFRRVLDGGGALFPVGDADRPGRRVLAGLLDDPDAAPRAGRARRRKVVAKYDWPVLAQQVLEVYADRDRGRTTAPTDRPLSAPATTARIACGWWVVVRSAVLVLVAVVRRVDGRPHRPQPRPGRRRAGRAGRAAGAPGAPPRSEAADALGDSQLRWAARVALEADPDEREAAENDLTRVLRPLLSASHERDDPAAPGRRPDAPLRTDLAGASRRVALARQVHNDVVRDALALRRRRLLRVLRLARRHPVPAYFDIDDPA